MLLRVFPSRNCLIDSVIMSTMLLVSCAQVVETPPLDNTHDPQSSSYVPYSPTELRVVQNSDKAVDVYWQNGTQYTTQFEIERKDQSSPYHVIGEVSRDSLHFRDTTGVILGTPYAYRIGALAASRNIGYSEECPFSLSFPSPSHLSVTSPGISELTLSWTNNAPFAGGFILERSADNGGIFEPRQSTTLLTATENGLLINDEYTYRVKAFTPLNVSDPSLPLQVWCVPDSARLAYQRGDFNSQIVGPVVLSPDREYVAFGGGDYSGFPPVYSVFIVQPGANQFMRSLVAFTAPVFSLQFSPDGQFIATSDDSGGVRVWNVSSGQLVRSFANSTGVFAIAYCPDGQTIACGSYGVVIRDVSSGSVVASWSENGSVMDLVFTPDGRTLVVATSEGIISWRDPSTGALLETQSIAGRMFKFSANAQYLAKFGLGNIVVMKTSNWTLVGTVAASTVSAVVSNDGTVLTFSNSQGGSSVFDLRKGALVKSLTTGSFAKIGSSQDGLTIASGYGGTISLWQLQYRWATH